MARKTGPTPKPDHELHSERITLLVTPAQDAQIRKTAEKAGLGISTWLREVAIGASK